MEKKTKLEYIPPKSQVFPIFMESLLQKTSVMHNYPQSTEEDWNAGEKVIDKEIDIDD